MQCEQSKMTVPDTRRTKYSKVKDGLEKKFPIAQWLPHYTKLDIISDFVAGITVGLTMIPQSIAYASLAGLPAQYGLYTAFIGSFTYIVFGTIKQVSIGPTSLMSIMTFSYVRGYPIEFTILLTFLAGCVELTMGILRLGFLVDFISPCVSSGFTSATSIIIVVSQLGSFFGLKGKAHDCLGAFYGFFQNITNVKLGDTVLGVICVLFLFALKQITKTPTKNTALKKCLWFLSISRNAVIVAITAGVAFYWVNFGNTAVPFALSGKVPSGLPAFQFPHFSATVDNKTVNVFQMMQTLGTGLFVVPICAILANVAIAKSFTAGVIVDASQEMMTLGLCNIFGSCIQAMPSCGAFTRSAVANASGVRTPLQGLYSGGLIILALSFLTPYFYYIPKSTLAAVLISAVVSMIDYEILPVLWKTSRSDFWMTIITCCVGVIFGADIGIIIGALLNTTVLLRIWTRPKISARVKTGLNGETYLSINPELGLCYPSVDFLTEEVLRNHMQHETLIIAIDCRNVLKIDYAGSQALNNLVNMYNKDDKTLILTNVCPSVQCILKQVMDNKKFHLVQSTDLIIHVEKMSKEEVHIPLLDKNECDIGYRRNSNLRKKSLYDNMNES